MINQWFSFVKNAFLTIYRGVDFSYYGEVWSFKISSSIQILLFAITNEIQKERCPKRMYRLLNGKIHMQKLHFAVILLPTQKHIYLYSWKFNWFPIKCQNTYAIFFFHLYFCIYQLVPFDTTKQSVCKWKYICYYPRGLSCLWKELTVASCVMQSS